MLKYKDKIVHVIMNILVFIICLTIFFGLYNFIQLRILKKSYVNFFGYSIFEVVTGSMSGTIEVNDVIIVKITDKLEVGDIVTFTENGQYVTHRLIDMSSNEYITKGDVNNSKDVPVKRENILGKVIYIIPKIGVWKEVLMTPKVLISIFITIFLFCFCFSYDPNVKKEKDYSKKSKINQDEIEVLNFDSNNCLKAEKENIEILNFDDTKEKEEIEILI